MSRYNCSKLNINARNVCVQPVIVCLDKTTCIWSLIQHNRMILSTYMDTELKFLKVPVGIEVI